MTRSPGNRRCRPPEPLLQGPLLLAPASLLSSRTPSPGAGNLPVELQWAPHSILPSNTQRWREVKLGGQLSRHTFKEGVMLPFKVGGGGEREDGLVQSRVWAVCIEPPSALGNGHGPDVCPNNKADRRPPAGEEQPVARGETPWRMPTSCQH